MHRALRILFNALTLLSLVLALLVAVLWPVSYWWGLRAARIGREATWVEQSHLWISGGGLMVAAFQGIEYDGPSFNIPPHWDAGIVEAALVPAGAPFSWSFTRYDEWNDRPSYSLALSLPLWFLLVLTSLLPTVAGTRAILSRQRWGDSLCPTCGYDLRATPDRCPECGTAAFGHSA